MTSNKIYAGIGSRKTPADILSLMHDLGAAYALQGMTLRSGHAIGADLAFETGCRSSAGHKEIYLPWDGYNNAWADAHHGYFAIQDIQALSLAAKYHPAWDKCSVGTKRLHGRNMQILLGRDLQSPVDAVICWTPRGEITGGTGQALRAALDHDIRIVNLFNHNDRKHAQEYLKQMQTV